MSGSPHASMGHKTRVVLVREVLNGIARCSDNLQIEIQVPLLPNPGRLPQPGEQWVVDKALGPWRFVGVVVPVLPVIAVPKTGESALALALLEALSVLGLVQDQTT